MWPFSSARTEEEDLRLREVLDETIELVNRSEEGLYAGLSRAEIVMDLSMAISELDKDEKLNGKHLSTLFAPTGPIQETAMSSGWHEDYLRLSSEIDKLTRGKT
jgi:hypothetical protein